MTHIDRSVEEYRVSTKLVWLEKKLSAEGYLFSVKHSRIFQ